MLYYYKIRFDYIKFLGNDRLDLINRLSTNDINNLKKLEGIKTILTSDKGRFVDIITLYNFGDFIFSTCTKNNAASVINHLGKYTIMDDFKTENVSGTHESILFFGDSSENFVSDMFDIDISNFTNNDFSIYVEENRHSIVSKNDDMFGGFVFTYALKDKEYFETRLLNSENKINYKMSEADESMYETMRIEYGIPKMGKEMSELTNPLECHLNKYVSFTKGCYIGQEVIARLDSYDKISKHLVGIKSTDKFDIGSQNQLKLTVDNKECGFATSIATSEKFGNIGLGFVKTIFLSYEKDYKIKQGDNLTDCKIVELPFK
ncbi:MAG: YgfZ/GcvT domain-containing protein [Ignavibacteria bacterium]